MQEKMAEPDNVKAQVKREDIERAVARNHYGIETGEDVTEITVTIIGNDLHRTGDRNLYFIAIGKLREEAARMAVMDDRH